jgi:hypothetical protein
MDDENIPFAIVAGELLRHVSERPRSFPQVYFSLDEEPVLDLSGLECRRRRSTPRSAKFELTLSLEHAPNRLSGVLEYRKGTLGRSGAARLVKAFKSELIVIAMASSS